ncbi:MAG: hypothetical protein ACK4MW_06325 [Aquificaceae bacterium]
MLVCIIFNTMMELEIIKIRETVDEIMDMLIELQKDIEYIKSLLEEKMGKREEESKEENS